MQKHTLGFGDEIIWSRLSSIKFIYIMHFNCCSFPAFYYGPVAVHFFAFFYGSEFSLQLSLPLVSKSSTFPGA